MERLPWYSDLAQVEEVDIDLREWALWFDGIDETMRRIDSAEREGKEVCGDAFLETALLGAGSVANLVEKLEKTSDRPMDRMQALLLSRVYNVPTTITPRDDERSVVDRFMAVCPRCAKCGANVPYAVDELKLTHVCIQCDIIENKTLSTSPAQDGPQIKI